MNGQTALEKAKQEMLSKLENGTSKKVDKKQLKKKEKKKQKKKRDRKKTAEQTEENKSEEDVEIDYVAADPLEGLDPSDPTYAEFAKIFGHFQKQAEEEAKEA